jgi:phage terminase Nu1 subunit (DNA packaging protein)
MGMFNNINNRLAVLTSYYADLDAEIALQGRIVDTYLGLLAQGADVEQYLARAYGEIAALKADRREIDLMWNEALLAHEAAA